MINKKILHTYNKQKILQTYDKQKILCQVYKTHDEHKIL